MSKEEYVQLDTVKHALDQIVQDKEVIEQVLAALNEATVALNETSEVAEDTGTDSEGDEAPKVKKQYVIVVSDTTGLITKDLVGWVLQIPEDEDVTAVMDGIKKSAYNFNASKKGNKYPVSSIGQALANVSNKFFKPYNISVKTKEPVLVVTTNNVLPKS